MSDSYLLPYILNIHFYFFVLTYLPRLNMSKGILLLITLMIIVVQRFEISTKEMTMSTKLHGFQCYLCIGLLLPYLPWMSLSLSQKYCIFIKTWKYKKSLLYCLWTQTMNHIHTNRKSLCSSFEIRVLPHGFANSLHFPLVNCCKPCRCLLKRYAQK